MGFICRCFFRSQLNIFLTESWETLKRGRDGFSLVNEKYKVPIDSFLSQQRLCARREPYSTSIKHFRASNNHEIKVQKF